LVLYRALFHELLRPSAANTRTADLSVDYPTVVENYRAASDIAQRNRQGRASTEDLRQALVLYRALFHELLRPSAANTRTAASRPGERQANRRLNRGGFRA
jgi:hypothetical protein